MPDQTQTTRSPYSPQDLRRALIEEMASLTKEKRRLLRALIAVAYECDPQDGEWSDPVATRKYLWNAVAEALGGEATLRREIEAMNL